MGSLFFGDFYLLYKTLFSSKDEIAREINDLKNKARAMDEIS